MCGPVFMSCLLSHARGASNVGQDVRRIGRKRPYLVHLDDAIRLARDYCEPHLEALEVMQTLGRRDEARERVARVPAHCRADPRWAQTRDWAGE